MGGGPLTLASNPEKEGSSTRLDLLRRRRNTRDIDVIGVCAAIRSYYLFTLLEACIPPLEIDWQCSSQKRLPIITPLTVPVLQAESRRGLIDDHRRPLHDSTGAADDAAARSLGPPDPSDSRVWWHRILMDAC